MNAVIYARYSSHNQTEQSIEGQLRDNHAWAKQQGITVVAEYIDRALTGKTDARPDFQRMIEDAAKKQFEMVIVWKLDRFARNRYDSAIYKARLKKYGVRVVSVKESITDSPEGIILEGLLESMAEYYSANLSQNIRRGQRESIANGTYCGGTVPYGYRIRDKKLVADDKTAPVIRYVFEQYAQGVPKKEIIATLNERGVRRNNGKLLNYNTFAHALSNPVYIGKFTYLGEVVPDLAEQLIDEETFNKVQERIKLTSHAPAANKAKVNYLLQGKAWCGMCGSPMIGQSGKSSNNGEVYRYYSCSKKKRLHTCPKKNERKDFIEWYVVRQTVLYVLSADRINSVARAVVEEYNKEFSDNSIEILEKALNQIDRELDKLVDAVAEAPKVARAKIYEKMEALEARKIETETELARLRIAHSIRLTETEVKSWLKQFCTGDPDDEDFRRRIIDVFINAVYIYDDHLIIFYNVRGGKQVTYTDLLSSSSLPSDLLPSDLLPSDLSSSTLPSDSASSSTLPSDLLPSNLSSSNTAASNASPSNLSSSNTAASNASPSSLSSSNTAASNASPSNLSSSSLPSDSASSSTAASNASPSNLSSSSLPSDSASSSTAASNASPSNLSSSTLPSDSSSSNPLLPTLSPLSKKQKERIQSGSDLDAYGGADAFKSEPIYIFVNKIFGCIFHRNR